MSRTIVLGLALVTMMTALTGVTAVVGTAAASFALGRATVTTTITKIPAAPESSPRYVGDFARQS